MRKCILLVAVVSMAMLVGCENAEVRTSPEERDALSKLRSGQFTLVAKSELTQLTQDAETARASAKRDADSLVLDSCLEIDPTDTRLSQSSNTFSTTGDLRPIWQISGRVQNKCEYQFDNVVFEVDVKKGDSKLDSGELTLKGPVMPLVARGFIQNIQLRIEQEGWSWAIGPKRGQIIP